MTFSTTAWIEAARGLAASDILVAEVAKQLRRRADANGSVEVTTAGLSDMIARPAPPETPEECEARELAELPPPSVVGNALAELVAAGLIEVVETPLPEGADERRAQRLLARPPVVRLLLP